MYHRCHPAENPSRSLSKNIYKGRFVSKGSFHLVLQNKTKLFCYAASALNRTSIFSNSNNFSNTKSYLLHPRFQDFLTQNWGCHFKAKIFYNAVSTLNRASLFYNSHYSQIQNIIYCLQSFKSFLTQNWGCHGKTKLFYYVNSNYFSNTKSYLLSLRFQDFLIQNWGCHIKTKLFE